jgi:tetratricopeptide (TPR) repeat protein
VSCFRQALDLAPDFHEASYALATVLSATGCYDEALALYERLLRLQPDNAGLVAAVGGLYEFRGEQQKARDYLRVRLEKNPSLEIAAVYARCVDDDPARGATAAIIAGLLAGPIQYSRAQRRDALYTLGGLYDRLCDHERAFSAYAQANALERHVLDMAAIEQEFAELQEGSATPAARYQGNPSTRPVFIVGMPRSGTTLAEQILASHSQVHGAGELDDIARLVSRVRKECGMGKRYLRCLPEVDPDFLAGLADEYLRRLDALNPTSLYVVDKMPHNFLALGLISVLFPRARIIHCSRDPRDTCLSIYFQHFTGNHPYTSNLHALGRYYRLYLQLMEYWRAVLPLDMLELNYRDVVLDPGESARRLIGFCGLEWEPQCLEFHRNKQLVTTPTYSDVRQPVYTRSLERWRHYADRLDELLTGLGPGVLP